jgi:drug/metabolite transporter (DMT)-like permease
MINPSIAVIYSELILSLYPILVKSVDVNLFTQTLSRFIVFPILAITFGKWSDFTALWSSPTTSIFSIIHGLLNLAHVAVSYLSFKLLPAGTAVPLFYLYPVFDLIAGTLLFGDKLPLYSFVLFIVATIGAYVVASAKDSSTKTEKSEKEEKSEKLKRIYGITAAILAAITETLIYSFVRSNKLASDSPFYAVNSLYIAGLAVLFAAPLFSKKKLVNFDGISWSKLIGFNALLGFTGYVARFFSMPRLPVVVFSLLSFVGVISANLWSTLFTHETISKQSIAGGLMIAGSIAGLRLFKSS